MHLLISQIEGMFNLRMCNKSNFHTSETEQKGNSTSRRNLVTIELLGELGSPNVLLCSFFAKAIDESHSVYVFTKKETVNFWEVDQREHTTWESQSSWSLSISTSAEEILDSCRCISDTYKTCFWTMIILLALKSPSLWGKAPKKPHLTLRRYFASSVAHKKKRTKLLGIPEGFSCYTWGPYQGSIKQIPWPGSAWTKLTCICTFSLYLHKRRAVNVIFHRVLTNAYRVFFFFFWGGSRWAVVVCSIERTKKIASLGRETKGPIPSQIWCTHM